MTSAPLREPVDVDPTVQFRMSRFAFARRDAGTLIIESPLAPVRVLLHGQPGGALLARLADPVAAEELQSVIARSTLDEARAVLAVLIAAEVVGAVDEHGTILAEETPALRTWEFHDLLVHTRSRRGRHDLAYGGTYRFMDELPATARPGAADVESHHPVARADARSVGRRFLTHVLEHRRSTRASARHRSRWISSVSCCTGRPGCEHVLPSAEGRPYDVTRRPYPGGGAAYELELYPLVHRCDGLDPRCTAMTRVVTNSSCVADRNDLTDALLADATWSSASGPSDPRCSSSSPPGSVESLEVRARWRMPWC